MDSALLEKRWHYPKGSQGIGHQRSSTRAEFDKQDIAGHAHLLPSGGAPKTDQLAEHLADLWRGDKIAFGAKRVFPRVIAVFWMEECGGHKVSNGDRAFRRDTPLQNFSERCHS